MPEKKTVNNKKPNTKKQSSDIRPLTAKEKAFCQYYIELNNATQAAIKAGYSAKTARTIGARKLTEVHMQSEIAKLRKEQMGHSIATAQQVMEYFTRVMNGEEKDQFGLEASLSERTRAAQELAKRTVDLDNKLKGLGNAEEHVVTIKVDWNR